MTVSPRGRAAAAVAFAASFGIALGACGSTSGSSSTSSASSPSTGTTAAGPHTVHDAALGTIVENGKGFTLYRFDIDSAKPSASHCTGQCAIQWPAAPAVNASTVTGVDHKLLGSVKGTDGQQQLTLAGWPLYTYAQDSKAGDTHGQGVDGTWWAVTPSGAKAMTGTAPGTSPATTSGGNGY
ncbi:MAG: hypothetical protein QOF98_3546 [Streptomyces sp.]|jgi:predicted lipoprotein with Yx(FWY)xxD motif|nr:hypothetical protein [Streptomyces sp.]